MHAGFGAGVRLVVVVGCLVLVMLLVPAPALALDGSYSASGAKGSSALLLKSQGGRVTGSLRHGGASYVVSGRLEDGALVGELRGNGKRLYIEAQPAPQGDGLVVLIAAIGADGQPDDSTEQLIEFQRGGTAAPAARPPMPAAAPAPPQAGPASADGAVAGTPQDRQVAQFLAASPWCHYSYSGGSQGGTEKRERVVFFPDGRVVSRDGSESAYSGQVGGQAWGTSGQQGGGQQGRWRVRQGTLEMAGEGQPFQPVPLRLTQNSNGHPILTTNGKEYFRCN